MKPRLMRTFKSTIAAFVLITTLTAAMCPEAVDRMRKLNAAVAFFEPFVQTLGILPEKLKPIIADGKDIVSVASQLTADFSVAETRAQKFAAADKAQKAVLLIINRGNFQVDQRVMNVVNLISAAFSSVALYYSDIPRASEIQSEKAFLKDLDKQIKALEAAMR